MTLLRNALVLIAGTCLATLLFHLVVIGGFTIYHLTHS